MSEETERLKEMNLSIQQLESDIKVAAESLSAMRKELKTKLDAYLDETLASFGEK